MAARTEAIRHIHRQYAPFYNIGGGLVLIAVGIWIGSLIFDSGYATNVYTEALSVIATIAVLDRLNDWRDMRRLKAQLRREAASRDNSTALNAVDWLRAMGWLSLTDRDHLLCQQKLARANLENSFLYEADLEGCNFYKARLKDADISRANLRDAYFHRADLTGASVYDTDFRGAVLWMANLRNVRHIDKARFDERTALPDSRPLRDEQGNIVYDAANRVVFDRYWSAEVDMTRYTNPDHRNFLRIE